MNKDDSQDQNTVASRSQIDPLPLAGCWSLHGGHSNYYFDAGTESHVLERRWATPRLQAVIDGEPRTPDERRQQLHARLALLKEDENHLPTLVQALLRADVSYVGLIRDTLQPHLSRFVEDLWKTLRDVAQPAAARFRAGLALANYVPGSEQWNDSDRRFLVEQLVTANPEHQPIDIRALVFLDRLT